MAQNKKQNKSDEFFGKTQVDTRPPISRDMDFSMKYVREVIDAVNLNPNPKNILKMQQVLNTFLGGTGFGTPIREDYTLGNETKDAVKAFRAYEAKIENIKRREKLEKAQQKYEKERTKFGPVPSVFNFLKDEDSVDLNKVMSKKKDKK
jgi:hypothetical protein|tara:strand:+ start:182 stop:628 length:447 start_codon:yes stop_codon:yes gene_type:complete